MSSKSTISIPEAEALQECFISLRDHPEVLPQDNTATQRFPGDVVFTCAEKLDLGTAVENLKIRSLINEFEVDYCDSCGTIAELCNQDSHRYERRREYRIQSSELIEEWTGWLNEETELESVNKSQITENHWRINATLDKEEITFETFFSLSDSTDIDIEPKENQFGMFFLDYQLIPDVEHCFSWIEPLEIPQSHGDGFENQLRELISKYKDAISASFVDTDDVKPFRRSVRKGIMSFFKSKEYKISREISNSVNTLRKYGISPRGDDFAAIGPDDTETLLICRCDKSPGSYHIHRFIDQEITSTEDSEELNSLIERLDSKIDKFINIQDRKSDSQNYISIITGGITIASSFVIVDTVFPIIRVFNNFLPENVSIPIELKLLIIGLNALLIIIFLFIFLKPIYDQLRFDWTLDAH